MPTTLQPAIGQPVQQQPALTSTYGTDVNPVPWASPNSALVGPAPIANMEYTPFYQQHTQYYEPATVDYFAEPILDVDPIMQHAAAGPSRDGGYEQHASNGSWTTPGLVQPQTGHPFLGPPSYHSSYTPTRTTSYTTGYVTGQYPNPGPFAIPTGQYGPGYLAPGYPPGTSSQNETPDQEDEWRMHDLFGPNRSY